MKTKPVATDSGSRWRFGRHAVAFGALAAVATVFIPVSLPDRPDPPRFTDRNGTVLVQRPVPERAAGQWVNAFPESVVQATINAEDHRFEEHFGIDPIGIVRAFRVNVEAGEVRQGGSTITQQLVRNVWERPPGVLGKAWEAWMAMRLDASYSKKRIVTEYLNRIYFGNHAYGLDAAAHVYFDKTVEGLSISETALLVALPRRPTDLDPWKYPAAAIAERNKVLERMAQLGQLTPERLRLAVDEPLGLRTRYPWSHAPHFVRRLSGSVSGEVRTTLDFELQQAAKNAVEETVASLNDWGVSHGSVLIVDNRTAEVLAYVGSADWSADDGQVDAVMAKRSPGSTLKPFLVALALQKGVGTLATVQSDLPGNWSTTHGTWSPTNYDNSFSGPVLMRSALARSLNVPMVRLLEQVGVANFLRTLRDLGMTSLVERPEHYGLGLVLGDGEVRLDELVGAYRALADEGRYRPLVFLADDQQAVEPTDVIDDRVAWLVRDALDDAGARAPAFGVDSVLEADVPLAAKTGTSVGWRDNWAVGITPAVTIGVWVGNFDGAPMNNVSGISGAAPMLRLLVDEIHSLSQGPDGPVEGITSAQICPLSGFNVGADCPGGVTEYFLEGTGPIQSCAWHKTVHVSLDGSAPCTERSARLAVDWPPQFEAWAAESGQMGVPDGAVSCGEPGAVATESPLGEGSARIVWPTDGLALYLDPRDPPEQQAMHLRAAVPHTMTELEWVVDGERIASVGSPYTYRWVPTVGEHRLSIESDGNTLHTVRVWVGGGQ